jgi:hypothetical protein
MYRRPVDNRLFADAWSDAFIIPLLDALPGFESLLPIGDMAVSTTWVKTIPSRMISANEEGDSDGDDDALRPG